MGVNEVGGVYVLVHVAAGSNDFDALLDGEEGLAQGPPHLLCRPVGCGKAAGPPVLVHSRAHDDGKPGSRSRRSLHPCTCAITGSSRAVR